MSKIDDKSKYIISKYIAPAILDLGFKRYKQQSWVRRKGDAVQRAIAGLDKVRGYSYAWIGVGIGVAYQSLADFLHPAPSWIGLGDVKSKVPSMMGGLIGYLDPEATDNQWYLAEDSNEDLIGNEILDAIQRVALPFWRKYESLDVALEVWRLPPVDLPKEASAVVDMYVAAAYCLRGDKERGLRYMEERIAELSDEYDKRMVNSLWNAIDCRRAFVEFLKER